MMMLEVGGGPRGGGVVVRLRIEDFFVVFFVFLSESRCRGGGLGGEFFLLEKEGWFLEFVTLERGWGE